MLNPLVSVIIPTKNRYDLLQRCIDSVFAQSYQNFEVIVYNDASTDNTSELLTNMKSKDCRLVFIDATESVGAAKGRNIALVKAKGEFVCFLDDDDEWEVEKLEIQLQWASECSIVGCLSRRVDGFKTFGVSIPQKDQMRSSKEYKVRDIKLEDVFFNNGGLSPSNIMTKKEYLVGVDGFDEGLVASQGRDLFVRIIHKYGNAKMIDLYLAKHYQMHGINRISDSKNHVVGGWMEFKKNRHLMSRSVSNWRLTALYLKEYKFSDRLSSKIYWLVKAIVQIRFWRFKSYLKMFINYLFIR